MLRPDEIAQRRFLVALRGFDRDEVTEFLQEVGEEVRQLRSRVAELEAELARAQRAGDDHTGGADPRTAFRELGEETTRILVAAEESADEIQAKAREAGRAALEEARREARETTEQANRQAARMVAEAERRRDAIAAEVASLRDERDDFVARLREAVTTVADAVGGLVDEEEPPGSPVAQPADAGSSQDLSVTVAPEIPSSAPDDADTATPVIARAHAPETTDEEVPEEPTGEVTAEAAPEASTEEAAGTAAPGIAAVTASTAPTEQDAAPAETPSAEAPPAERPTVGSLRDASLTSLREGMARQCKRGLQDVQNEVLASIREQGRSAELTDLLPSEDDLGELADLGADQLEAAYRAALDDAATALDTEAPTAPGDGARVTAALHTFRTVLAHEVTSALRATLRAGLEAGEPDPQLSERVGEIFRDLRGPVLEGIVDEQLYRTYGLGLLDAWTAMDVQEVRWEVGQEARCPENRCRTNASEGPVAVGADFPSGDRVPPAHPGCTCVVVPA